MTSSTLSFTNRRWTLSPEVSLPSAPTQRFPPLVARCLAARTQGAAVRDWLEPSPGHFHDPALMLGMDRAIARIRDAVARQQRIRIVTDYDVDGTTSSLILQQTLARIGGQDLIDYHIPDRFTEGYGFSATAARKAAADGVGLIVTADIGVKDHEAVNAAADAGVDVIICDHHLPAGESVPERAYAVLCPPQHGCRYPNKSLAACGVSLKLAQALLADHPKRDQLIYSMLKVAAIGTVADVVDLSGLENRAIVALGLEQIRRGPNAPGLQALLEVSQISQPWLDATDIGFKISPRINAAGRLTEATAVIRLLTERDPAKAKRMAQHLDALNDQRREIQDQLVQRCLDAVGDVPPDFIVLWGEEAAGWHRGVVGIVAARLRDALHRPTTIISVCGQEARGSVRSTDAIHAVQALESAAHLLDGFGGHPAAAGFSTQPDRLEALRDQLNAYASATHSPEDTPPLRLDADCRPGDLNWRTIEALQVLGPHGKGNPRPLLWVRGVQPTDIRQLSGGKHLKFRSGSLEVVWWGGGQFADRINRPIDLAAEAGFNRWQGRTTPQLTITDIAPAATP